MKKKPSKKHHYLPRYYLKGFTDSKGSFFVYDKCTDKIFPTSPSAAFFKNNLNTVTLPNGSPSDFIEGLYTEMENQSWASLDSIRDSTLNTPIKPLDRMNLFLFLLFLHWSLPSNIGHIEKLSEEFFHADNELDYFRLASKTGDAVSKDAIERITSSPAFKKSSKTIVPFAPFFKDKNWAGKIENWRFIYSGDEKNWFVVGDNPIITQGDTDHDPVNCLNEFIFPVSGKILLVSVHRHISQELPPEFTIQYSAGIIERAQRFVACQNKNLLEALIKYYKLHVQYGKADNIIMELFEMVEEKEGKVRPT